MYQDEILKYRGRRDSITLDRKKRTICKEIRPADEQEDFFFRGEFISEWRVEVNERVDSLDEIRELAPEVVRQMDEMLRKDKVPPMVKVRIMEIILERTYGKPETSIKLTNAQQNVEAAQERLEAIFGHVRIE